MLRIRDFLQPHSAGRQQARGPKRFHPGLNWLEGRVVLSVLLVGPTETYKVPSQAAAAAKDGDTVKIDAGTYKGDVAIWKANNLTIEGVNGVATMDDTGVAIPNRKGIWVIDGNNTKVANIEFTGAHDAAGRDRNWAGIRQEGSTLTVTNCSFHNNDDGILVDAGATSDITILRSSFDANGYGDGYSHNIYVGQVRTFTLEYSSSTAASAGHLVKSRALTNNILYNSLIDGPTGTTSYEVDLPNGGTSYVIGNVIEQGPKGQNPTMLSYAEEGATNPGQQLYVVNNTFVNDLRRGTFVSVAGSPSASRLVNNIFAFGGTVLSGSGTFATNLVSDEPGFADAAKGNYHLTAKSAAVNAGSDPGSANNVNLTPVYEYAGLRGKPRPRDGNIDVGAYEF